MSMRSIERGRRGNGEGSCQEVRRLANGEMVYAWSIRATRPTGERTRLKGTFQGRSIQDARNAMWEAKRACEAGQQVVDRSNMTVGELLTEWMERDRKHAGVSPRTLQIQEDLIRLHIRPQMQGWKVRAVNARLIKDFHADLMRSTPLERGRQQIQGILRQALNYAVVEGLLGSNPVLSVKLPKRQERRKASARTKRVKAWTPTQAGRLERAALETEDMLGFAIAFALRTGLRKGELFGLKWSHVDLEGRTLRVEEVLSTHGTLSRSMTEPKNESSRREIRLNQAAIDILGQVWALQNKQRKADQAPAEFVFTTRRGEMQHPNNANRKLTALLDQEKLTRLPFHSLRHTFVSVAAHQGWSIKQVSVYIGHSNTVVTQQTYTHLWPEHQEAIEIELK